MEQDIVRKRWLKSFIIYTAVGIVTFWLLAIFEGLLKGVPGAGSIFLGLAATLLITAPAAFITYHCAYKKRGTRWLMWLLIAIPLRELIEIVSQALTISTLSELMVDLPVLALMLGIEIYYWINCLRLYRANAARKQTLAVASL